LYINSVFYINVRPKLIYYSIYSSDVCTAVAYVYCSAVFRFVFNFVDLQCSTATLLDQLAFDNQRVFYFRPILFFRRREKGRKFILHKTT